MSSESEISLFRPRTFNLGGAASPAAKNPIPLHRVQPSFYGKRLQSALKMLQVLSCPILYARTGEWRTNMQQKQGYQHSFGSGCGSGKYL